MSSLRAIAALALSLVACGGGGGGGGDGDFETTVSGGVQKGPFILGSSIAISTVDNEGDPTGTVFQTQTSSDRGEFSVDVLTAGLVSIEANGFYYNEVTGTLSGAQGTLRAFADPSTPPVYVNLITHLTYDRVHHLLQDGTPFAEAVDQAEGELRAALGIGPPGFDPGIRGNEMDVMGGDSDANAYLFAASAVIIQTALIRSGSGDAGIQELSNTVSADLADDGSVSPTLTTWLVDGHRAVDPDLVMSQLTARFAQIGSSAEVPDLNRMLDTDGDGLLNVLDNCPKIANADQLDSDGNGVGDLCAGFSRHDIATGVGPDHVAVADLDGDSLLDIVTVNPPSQTVSVLRNTTVAGSTTPTFAATLDVPFGGTPTQVAIADFNSDGKADLLVRHHDCDPNGCPGSLAVLLNTTLDGATALTFAPGVDVAPLGGNCEPSRCALVATDLDGDGRPDVVANEGVLSVSHWLNTTAPGSMDPSVGAKVDIPLGGVFVTASVSDVDQDGKPDLVVLRVSDSNHFLDVFRNTTVASGAPTFEETVVAQVGGDFGTQYGCIATGDFNGDGAPDLAVSDFWAHLSVFLNTTAAGATTASFGPQSILDDLPPLEWTPLAFVPTSLAVGDLDGNGSNDILAAFSQGGLASFFNTTPSQATLATFVWRSHPMWTASLYLAVGDLNVDGLLDGVVTWIDEQASGASVMLGQ